MLGCVYVCDSVWLLWDGLIGAAVIPLGECEVCVCDDLSVTAWVWVCPQVPVCRWFVGFTNVWIFRVPSYRAH